MADILFIIYIIMIICVVILCVHPKGIELQQEYLAWRTVKDYMASRNIRWP